MHIAVDMDDVILDFFGGIATSVRKEYGVDLNPEDMTVYDLHKIIDPIIGRSWWSWLRERDWLWSNFPAVDGAIGGIDQLRRAGHYLEIVTAKPDWATYAVWKWLGKWRPIVHRVTIVPSGDGTTANKAEHSGADLLIDDHIKNCQAFADDGRKALLFSQPHNRDLGTTTLPAGIVRVQDWRGVLAAVELESEGLL